MADPCKKVAGLLLIASALGACTRPTLPFRFPASKPPEPEQAELKAVVDPSHLARLLKALGMAEPTRERTIYFFDTHDLALHVAGVTLRARIAADGDGDTTVKIHEPVARDGSGPDEGWLERDGFKCERDTTLGPTPAEDDARGRRNCSYTRDQAALAFARVMVARDRPPETLFSPKQLKYFERFGSGQPMTGLLTLGPVRASTWKSRDDERSQKITVELWDAGDGARMLEVSLRSPVTQSVDASRQLRDLLQLAGVPILAEGTGKTQWVLRKLVRQPRLF